MLFIKKFIPLLLLLFLVVSLPNITLANTSDDDETSEEVVVENKRPRRIRVDNSELESERNGVNVSRNRKHGVIRRYSVGAAKGTAKGTSFLAVGAAKGTAEGATGAAKGTSVAATSTAYATSVAAKKTAKATTTATKAVIGAFK